MKIKIYKLYFIIEDDNEEELRPKYIFEQTELLTESMLKTRLKQAIIDEQLNEDTLERFDLTRDTDPEKFTTDEIVEIFEWDGYCVQENILDL